MNYFSIQLLNKGMENVCALGLESAGAHFFQSVIFCLEIFQKGRGMGKRVNSTSEVKNMDKISVVVPCYNEEEALPVYYKEMCRVMDEMKDVVFELIFVDDGSSDATLGIMKDLNEKDSRCRYLSFSRNFGKEAAIYAGLKASEGDYVALMDVDLQDPPALLPEMYEILQEDGYDNVATKRPQEPESHVSVLSCRKLLQICKCYFKDRDCRWSERLPADEAEDGAGSSGNERV